MSLPVHWAKRSRFEKRGALTGAHSPRAQEMMGKKNASRQSAWDAFRSSLND